MPARNEIFRTQTRLAVEGRRYYWGIVGAHTDALSSPTVTMLPESFDGPPVWSFAHDHTPLGIGGYEAVSHTLELAEIRGLNLYTYLQDAGVLIGYTLRVNSVWTLYSDMGDGTADEDDFSVVAAWVHVSRDEDETVAYSSGRLTMDMELLHVGVVTLQNLPVTAWGQDLIDHISRLNGVPDSGDELDITIRTREYETAYRDSDNIIYAVVNQKYRPHDDPNPERMEERIYLRYLDCFYRLEAIAEQLYRKIIRSETAALQLRSTFAGDIYTDIGTPYDFTTRYRQGLDVGGSIGAALVRFDLQWLCFIKEEPGDDSEAIAGLLYPGNGSRQASGWCKEYSDVYTLLADMTIDGTCQGVLSMSGTASSGVDLMLKWYKVHDGDIIAADDMPPTDVYSVAEYSDEGASDEACQAKIRRAGYIVGGCDVSTILQVGQNESTIKYRPEGIPSEVGPYTLKSPITTAPCQGGSHHYWIAIPTDNVDSKDVYQEYGEGDFGGGDHERVIRARALSSWNRWFYLQPSDTSGDGTGPDWIDAAEPIVMVCHNHVTHDIGPVPTADNAAGGDILMPTLADAYGTTDLNGFPKNLFDRWYDERMIPALRERQRQSSMWCTATVIGTAFGSPSQCVIEVDIERPSVYSDSHRATRYTIDPRTFIPDRPDVTAHTSVVVSIESDLERGIDHLILWTAGDD